MVHLLGRYSSAYASIQFRALRQFFKWLAAEESLPDPMGRLCAPKVTAPEVPVFTLTPVSPRATTGPLPTRRLAEQHGA